MDATLPGECNVKWCDETADHHGPHAQYLGDLAGIDSTSGERATLQVVLTGDTTRDRHVELIAANTCTVQILLTWPQVTWLGAVMHNAVHRYG